MIVIAENRPRAVVFIATAIPLARTSAFWAGSAADPAQKAEVLAKGIAVAMNTTAFGLFSAITIMMIHAFLVAKSEKIINEVDEFSVKLIDLLGTKKASDE